MWSRIRIVGILIIVLGVVVILFVALSVNTDRWTQFVYLLTPTRFAVAECTEATSSLYIGETALEVYVVDTPVCLRQGLSGTPELPSNTGMLFVFSEPDFYRFWMKDMQFPIDIVWIDEHKKIVHIERNVSPDTYPKNFVSEEKAQYVLEVNAGFTETHDLLPEVSVNF